MKKTLVLSLVGLCSFGLTSFNASAVLDYDFDAVTPDYTYGYTYAEGGTHSHDGGVFAPSAGQGGTGGWIATFDMTGATGGWAGFGGGFGDWVGVGNYGALANASSLADITFSLDAKAGGLTGASAGVTFELKFEGQDDTIVPADGDEDTDVLLMVQLYPTLTSSFQTITSSLDAWTVTEGSFEQLQAFVGGVENINLNIGYGGGGDVPEFGNDADNTLSADNYSITVVPEPSGLALLGLGLAGVALIKRRKA